MEERLPPPAPSKGLPPLPPPPSTPRAAQLETYVVQIPRDQIYRIPPPEHALIVETHNHRNAAINSPSTARRRKTLFWVAAVPVVLILVAVAAILTARATLYKPAPPGFAVARFQARNLEHGPSSHRRPEFEVTLRAENPNKRLSVSYRSGNATLVYENKEIGHGKVESTIKHEPGGGGGEFPVVLAGNVAALSMEVERSLNGTTDKSMALMMEVGIEMNSWIRKERRNVRVSCDFRVRNSLAHKNKVSFQECQAEF